MGVVMINTKDIILKHIIMYIQSYRDSDDQLIKDNHMEAIKKDFYTLKVNNEISAFYDYMKREFQNEHDMYILLLSVLYHATIEGSIMTEILSYLCQNEMDIYTKLGIRTQIEAYMFRNSNAESNYRLRRKLQQQLVKQYEDLLDMQMPYIHLSERNHNRIVIITNQLLEDLHAPTNLTKEICYVLQKLQMDVLLVVAYEEADSSLGQVWFEPLTLYYIKEYNGNFITERYGEEIKGYQIIINRDNINEIKELIMKLYEFNPLCVWYMGNLSIFPDLLKRYTTELAMTFGNGYAISEAQIMISYLNTQSLEIKDMETFLTMNDQHAVQYKLRIPINLSKEEYSKKQFGFCDDDFLIAIAGNRLDSEITSEFLQVLKSILEFDAKISIVFIGCYNNYKEIIKDELFNKRTSFLGYRNDLLGVLSIMNLFVNPPRKGGGTGAIYSIYSGVPVVTLDDCDVAACVTPEFICTDLEEMQHVIKRYITDPEFYQFQSERAKLIDKNLSNMDEFAEDTKSMLEEAKLYMK